MHAWWCVWMFVSWVLSLGEVAQWLSRNSNPKTLIGDAGWRTVFLSVRAHSCVDLSAPDPPFVHMARTRIFAHVKDLISICCKRVGLTAGEMETGKHSTLWKNKKKLPALYYGCLLSSGESSPNFLCIALGQDIFLKSNHTKWQVLYTSSDYSLF